MARGPHQHQRNEWTYFFFGSPKRALYTALGFFSAFAALFPNVAMQLLTNVVNTVTEAVGPSVGPLLGIVIAIWAIWAVMLRPFKSKKNKKKDDH